jgi:hypothetical protein
VGGGGWLGGRQRIRYEWENQSLKKSDIETSSDKHWRGGRDRGRGPEGQIEN